MAVAFDAAAERCELLFQAYSNQNKCAAFVCHFCKLKKHRPRLNVRRGGKTRGDGWLEKSRMPDFALLGVTSIQSPMPKPSHRYICEKDNG